MGPDTLNAVAFPSERQTATCNQVDILRSGIVEIEDGQAVKLGELRKRAKPLRITDEGATIHAEDL